MSDLISRSKVYIEMEEFFNDYCNNSTVFDEYDTRIIKIAFEKLFQRFRQIPTAYNTDKVVEQLEAELKLAETEEERCIKENSLQFERAEGYANGMFNAIEIVKAGGVDES